MYICDDMNYNSIISICMHTYARFDADYQGAGLIDSHLGKPTAWPAWPREGVLLQRPYYPDITGGKAFLNAVDLVSCFHHRTPENHLYSTMQYHQLKG